MLDKASLIKMIFEESKTIKKLQKPDKLYIGSAELISGHRQRVADVTPHSDEVDKKPP